MINDTINPMGLDLTKNLHGHVRVELRDRWTGRVVDSQEKDNLVTNAVQEAMQSMPLATGINSVYAWLPIFSAALGGLFLFDGTLTESVTNTSFPSSVKMVAYAGQGANSTAANQGSYNANESSYTSNGFISTWDFLTSQANGTIASLARTSSMFVNAPCFAYVGTDSFAVVSIRSTNQLGSYCNVIGYDETNHYVYIAVTAQRTEDGLTFYPSNIYRAKFNFAKVGVNYPPLFAPQLTSIKTLTSSDGSASAYNYAYDRYNNEFVYITGTTIHIVATDGTHTTKTATGTSGTAFAITENYYWRATGSVVYRISKSNTSSVESISVTGGNHITPFDNDCVYTYSDGFNSCSLVYPDGTVMPLPASTISTAPQYAKSDYKSIGRTFYDSRGVSSMNLRPSTHYLGTIANLDSPVTKTSSQTMKITYTLTEA